MKNQGGNFEDEVRRIARLLWPTAEFDGATMEDGQERDGVFETDEFVHIIECTISKSKAKAEEDLAKLQKLARKLAAKHPQKFIKGWFITKEEPTAEQRSLFRAEQGRIVSVSFDQFRSRLVDAISYLTARDSYSFGSISDPETGNRTDVGYVPLDILDSVGNRYSVKALAEGLLDGRRFVVLGDYGAGKSVTLRETFSHLAKLFRTGKTLAFPLAINLRDHHGQTDPVEAIERHARKSDSRDLRTWYGHGEPGLQSYCWMGLTKSRQPVGLGKPSDYGIFVSDPWNSFDPLSAILLNRSGLFWLAEPTILTVRKK